MQLVSISKYINESQLRGNGNRYPNRNSDENSIFKYISSFFLLRFDKLFRGSKNNVYYRGRIEITKKYNVIIIEY